MRWLDIDIRSRSRDSEVNAFLERAQARYGTLAAVQHESGLDGPQVLSCLEEIGQLLFRAARAADASAFAPDRTDGVTRAPAPLNAPSDGDGPGYHLIVPDAALGLPWTALHNGVRFLIEQAPICVATRGSRPDDDARPQRPWMRRWADDAFTEAALGPASLGELVRRYRPEACAEPAILFLDGQGGDAGSAHGRRERDMIDGALEVRGDGARLARLETPARALTPATLAATAHTYGGFHFSGATAAAGAAAGTSADALDLDILSPGTGSVLDDDADLEVVGVDPVTALLDQINEKADAGALAPWTRPGAALAVALPASCWQLEDGPVRPEDLARTDAAPPLVFSNSYLSLQALGARFLAAGTSSFVGPQLALAPERASAFSAEFYNALARGNAAAEALRQAALACRSRWGAHHPAWLGYGILGSGALALQYL